MKKPTEEARARVIEAIRAQSMRDALQLSDNQWRLLNDRKERSFSAAEAGSELEEMEGAEDDVLELLFRYEQALPKEERKMFREDVDLRPTATTT